MPNPVQSGATVPPGPPAEPCAQCGLKFSAESLPFHQRACMKHQGDSQGSVCLECGRHLPPHLLSKHRNECRGHVSPSPRKAPQLDPIPTPAPDLRTQVTTTQRLDAHWEEPDDDISKPLFDHSIRDNDYDAVLYPLQPEGSIKRASPPACVLVDGGAAPILPALKPDERSTSSPDPEGWKIAESAPGAARSPSVTARPYVDFQCHVQQELAALQEQLSKLNKESQSAPRRSSSVGRKEDEKPAAKPRRNPSAAPTRSRANQANQPAGKQNQVKEGPPSRAPTPDAGQETIPLSEHQSKLEAVKEQAQRVAASKMSSMREEADKKDRELTKVQGEVAQLRQELEGLRRTMSSEKSKAEQEKRTMRKSLLSQIESYKEELNKRQREGDKDAASANALVQQLRSELSQLQSDHAKCRAELQRERTKSEKLQQVMRSQQSQQRAAAEKQNDRREALLTQREEQLAADLAKFTKEQQSLDRKMKSLDAQRKELGTLGKDLQGQRDQLAVESQEVSELQRHLASQQRKLEERAAQLDAREKELNEDISKQTAELKQIRREQERNEQWEASLQKRETALSEKTRSFGKRSDNSLHGAGILSPHPNRGSDAAGRRRHVQAEPRSSPPSPRDTPPRAKPAEWDDKLSCDEGWGPRTTCTSLSPRHPPDPHPHPLCYDDPVEDLSHPNSSHPDPLTPRAASRQTSPQEFFPPPPEFPSHAKSVYPQPQPSSQPSHPIHAIPSDHAHERVKPKLHSSQPAQPRSFQPHSSQPQPPHPASQVPWPAHSRHHNSTSVSYPTTHAVSSHHPSYEHPQHAQPTQSQLPSPFGSLPHHQLQNQHSQRTIPPNSQHIPHPQHNPPQPNSQSIPHHQHSTQHTPPQPNSHHNPHNPHPQLASSHEPPPPPQCESEHQPPLPTQHQSQRHTGHPPNQPVDHGPQSQQSQPACEQYLHTQPPSFFERPAGATSRSSSQREVIQPIDSLPVSRPTTPPVTPVLSSKLRAIDDEPRRGSTSIASQRSMLEEEKQAAIANEDYDKAKLLRDVIANLPNSGTPPPPPPPPPSASSSTVLNTDDMLSRIVNSDILGKRKEGALKRPSKSRSRSGTTATSATRDSSSSSESFDSSSDSTTPPRRRKERRSSRYKRRQEKEQPRNTRTPFKSHLLSFASGSITTPKHPQSESSAYLPPRPPPGAVDPRAAHHDPYQWSHMMYTGGP